MGKLTLPRALYANSGVGIPQKPVRKRYCQVSQLKGLLKGVRQRPGSASILNDLAKKYSYLLAGDVLLTIL